LAEDPNYLAHAFRSQYNLIGLGTAIGFALLAGSGLPLLLAVGVQLAVLPLVAGSDRFQRLVKARLLAEQRGERHEKKQAETSEMVRALSDLERGRFRGLETLTAEIRQNYKGLDASSQALLDDLVQKLDFLLGFYLRMRYSMARYEAYFQTTDPERLRERMAMIEHEMKQAPERLRQIKAKTRDVLVKRLSRYEKALENKQLIDAQTETVLEVMQLLRDQSYSMSDPRTITEQLDGLVSSAEETERGVRDMEDLLSDEQDLLLPGSLGPDIEDELGGLGAAREAAQQAPPPVRLPAAPVVPASPPPPPRKKLTH
jgi:hypothetical protein